MDDLVLKSFALGLMKKEQYLKKNAQRERYSENVIHSAAVYQTIGALYNDDQELDIDQVLRAENFDIGLIGPGDGMITRCLEYCLKDCELFHQHAILHDAWGRYYQKYKKGLGYTYALSSNRIPEFCRKSPLLGHISGLIFCYRNRDFLSKVISLPKGEGGFKQFPEYIKPSKEEETITSSLISKRE